MEIKLTDEEILDAIEKDLDRAEEIQDELASDRETYARAFRGDAYGNERDGWSKSIARIIWVNHQSNLCSLLDIFNSDFFMLKSDNYERSQKLQKLVRNQMFVKQDGYRHLYDFLYDCGLYHYGVLKAYKKDDFDIIYDKYDRLTLDELSMLVQQGNVQITKYTETTLEDGSTVLENVKVARKEVKYSGPVFESVDPWGFGYSPDCKRTDWGGIDGRLVYHQFKLSLNDIRKRERAGIYRKGTYDKCLEYTSEEDDKPSDQVAYETDIDGWSTDAADTTVERDESDLHKELTVRECYCKLDLDGDGLLEPSIVVKIEDDIVAQVEENPYKRPPFRIGGMLPMPHRVCGIAPPSILENDQKVMTNLLRFIQDQAAMSTYRNLITKDTRMQSLLQTRKPFDVIYGDPENIGEVPVQTADSFALKAYELLKGENEETTGSSRYNQGTDGASLNKTATGINLISRAAEKRLRMSARAIATSVLTGLVKDFIFINQKWKSDQPMPILGSDVVVEPDDVDGNFDIEVDIGVSQAERQLLVQQYDYLAQFGTQAGIPMGLMTPLHLEKIQKRKYNLFNINIDDLMLSEQEFAQEMQKREQNKPKEDWKEFVQMDKLYPLLARTEQAQILSRLGIQPDPNAQVAGIPQARDILANQSKQQDAQLRTQEKVQDMMFKREEHAMDMQGKREELRNKAIGSKIDLVGKIVTMKGKNDSTGRNTERD